MTENDGANLEGGAPNVEPTTDVAATLATLTTENESLKRTQASLQRELERVRRDGGNVKSLEGRLTASEDAQLAVLEAVGAIAAAGELKDVATKVTAVIEQVRKGRQTAAPPPSEGTAARAGADMVSAAESAGILEDKFEEAWKTDARFVEARALWRAGSHEAAAVSFRAALAKPNNVFTEEQVKQKVAEGVAAARRVAAPGNTGSMTTGNDRPIKASDIAKMPASDRTKYAKDLRAALKG